MKTAKDYFSSHMINFEPFKCSGGCDPIEIVPQLVGRVWDDLALGILHAFNPTSIRVTRGVLKMDGRIGRITVFVTDTGTIERVEQEVEIGIPGNTDEEIDRNHAAIHAILGQTSYTESEMGLEVEDEIAKVIAEQFSQNDRDV
jgi:hypothetical protein